MQLIVGFGSIALATIVALLPIVNPVSTAAIFLAITPDDGEEDRQRQARQGCIYMFWILVAFLLAGGGIMGLFGISIPGIRIAGGLVIARLALGMLRAESSQAPSNAATREARAKRDISFTPLAMPSLSGPGSIAVTIGLASEIDHWLDYPAIVLGIAATAWVSYLILSRATRIVAYLGPTGMDALTRIMGFLLLCVAVQFIVNGVTDIASDPQVLAAIAQAWPAGAR